MVRRSSGAKAQAKAKSRAVPDDDDEAQQQPTNEAWDSFLWEAVDDAIKFLREKGVWPDGQVPAGVNGLQPIPQDWTGQGPRLDRALATLADFEWVPGFALVTAPEVGDARRFWYPEGKAPDVMPTVTVHFDDNARRRA